MKTNVKNRPSRRFGPGDDLDDVRVGDVVMFGSTPHIVSRIEPYDPAKVGYPGEMWRIAYEDRPEGAPWAITICSPGPAKTSPKRRRRKTT